MVRFFKLFIFAIIVISLSDCTLKKDLVFYNVSQILEQLQKKELVANQLPFELVNILYLDTGLIEKLREVTPKYMSRKDIDINLFFIDDKNKKEIQLTSKYESVEDMIAKLDGSIKHYLKDSLGLENPKRIMDSNVLILNNKAFIEFLGEGSNYAITLEILPNRKAKLGIAYIVID